MSTSTINVKLKPHGHETLPVRLFFQTADWAVTQGICLVHRDRCFRLTHVPTTLCIPVCLQTQAVAKKISGRLARELKKSKSVKSISAQKLNYAHIVKQELQAAGLPLVMG